MTKESRPSSELAPPALATVFAIVWVASALFLMAVVAVASVLDRPLGDFTRDPTAVLEGPPYIGVVSNAGAVVWAITVGACLLATLTLGWPRCAPFLFGGLFTLLLLVDDLLQLHEDYYSRIVPQVAVPLFYGVMFIAYAYAFRSFLRRSGWVLAVSILLFAVSALLDAAEDRAYILSPYILEDGAKFLAITTWAVFFVFTATATLRAEIVLSPLAIGTVHKSKPETESLISWPLP